MDANLLNKRRSVVLAIVLSFLVPGLGHMYGGRARKGLFGYLLLWGLIVSAGLSGLMSKWFPVFLAALIIGVMGFLYLVVDAALIAKRTKPPTNQEYILRRYNRWYWYLLVCGLSIMFGAVFTGAGGRTVIGFETFHMPSGSMLPSLFVGDYFMVNTKHQNYARGDVIVFDYPQDPSQRYIKRIIGLPGDTIGYEQKRLRVNGELVGLREIEQYERKSKGRTLRFAEYVETIDRSVHRIVIDRERNQRERAQKWRIPEGRYLVMGDNRDHSNDSRYWGFVPKDNILGVATFVWWSWEFRDRIGMRIE